MLEQMVGGKRRRNDNASYGPSPPGSKTNALGQITCDLNVMSVLYMCGHCESIEKQKIGLECRAQHGCFCELCYSNCRKHCGQYKRHTFPA